MSEAELIEIERRAENLAAYYDDDPNAEENAAAVQRLVAMFRRVSAVRTL